jgi:predicted dinucleotide-binding enzyme
MPNSFPSLVMRRQVLTGLMGGVIFASATATPSFAQAGAMKIGFIGSGREGGALGTLFAKLGHPVMFSSRHPNELKPLVAAAGPNARAGTTSEAVAFGEIIVLAVPYTAVEQIGKDFGSKLAEKPLIIDVSNPTPRRDGEEFANQVASNGGAGLVTAKLLTSTRVVRAFNAINFAQLDRLAHQQEKIGVPIAGNDPKAIDLANRLIREAGFEPVLIGDLAKGKYLVPGTAVGGEHSPAELRELAKTLS